MPSLCHNIKQEYEDLKALKQTFVEVCTKAGNVDDLTKGDLIKLKRLKLKLEQDRDAFIDNIFASPESAKEVMGYKQFFGAEALKATFGIDFGSKDLPRTPFSRQELIRAKERGEYLIYRPGTLPDGTPLTIEKMFERISSVLDGKNRVGVTGDSVRDQADQTCRSGWALVSKEIISGTSGRCYLEQNRATIEYLVNVVFKNKNIPKEYQEAFDAFDQYISQVLPNKTYDELYSESYSIDWWEKHAQELSLLPITGMIRHTSAEIVFDSMMKRIAGDDKAFLQDTWIWTASRTGAVSFVGVRQLSSEFVRLEPWLPLTPDVKIGALLSRRS